MKYKLYSLIIGVTFSLPLMAQEPDTVAHFSLQEAIIYAQQHHNSVKNALIDQEIANNTVKQTIGIGLPQVNANASFQDFIKVPTSLLPGEFFGQPGTQIPVQFGVKYQSSMGLELNQLLFDGSYIVGLQASKTYKELSQKNLRRTRIETAIAVTKAYYSVLVSREQLTLLDANLIRLKKSLEDTEALYKNGFVEKIDVDRLRVMNNNLETERQNVIRLLALNLDLLKFQMGMSVGSRLTLKDSIGSLNTPEALAIRDTSSYRSRIEYSLLETQKRLNELDVKRYKSQFLPTLSAFGSSSQNYQADRFADLYDTKYPTTVIGLRLNVPLISGGIKIYQLRNARLAVLKSENDLANLRNGINLEIEQSQTSYTNSLASLENQRRNINLAEEVLRVARIKYEQGVGSSLEVTTAETALKEAQNNYITALYDLLNTRVDLDKALGKIVY